MNPTTEELDYITRMAAAAYTPDQVAFAMGYDNDHFKTEMLKPESDICTAYYKGMFSSELPIRESAFSLARSGSSPAQTLALKAFDELKKHLRIHGYTETEV